jgi:hypothetical protein
MPSFTSSSEARFVVALVTTLGVLGGTWEGVLRQRSGATVDVQMNSPPLAATSSRGEEWVVFGNCLMMTGVSPRGLDQQLPVDRDRVIVNIAWHEQSPMAFFEYLKRENHYPDVIVTNVSSWINGTNFEQESDLVTKSDPLGLARHAPAAQAGAASEAPKAEAPGAYRQDGDPSSGRLQRSVEDGLSLWIGQHARSLDHRYHLFDYTLFLGKLATTRDLDTALYQLNMQSWFRVTDSETDGRGYLGLRVQYRDDWSAGLDQMAERSLQRLRLSRLLTPRYWSLIEGYVRDFQSHGTKVVFVRMPEHPKIKAFNDETYDLTGRLRGLEERTGAPVLDLSRLGPAEGVHLFDAVHPDAASAEVITRAIGVWMRLRLNVGGADRAPREGGG